MAKKPAPRRKNPQPATRKTRNGRTAPATPVSAPAQTTISEVTAPLVRPEVDQVLADAADRMADHRDQAAAEAVRLLADGQARAAELVDAARTEAAAITKAVTAEQAQIIADAKVEADQVRTEAATTAAADADQVRADADATAEQLLADARRQADTVAKTAAGEAERVLADAQAAVEQLLADARRQAQEVTTTAAAQAEQVRTEATQVRAGAEKAAAALREEAGAALSRAQDQATDLAGAAERELEQARERCTQLEARAAGQYDARRAQAEQLYTDATRAADDRRREADDQVAAAHAEAEEARTRLRTQLREMGEEFDARSLAQRAALDKELADLKAARDKQRDQLRTEAKSVARELRETAEREADRLRKEAAKKAEGIISRAQADEARAKRLMDEAREAKRTSSRWYGWQQQLSRKAWKLAPWIALGAGVGLAASGEYKLATMVGIHPYVAPLLPVSIDVYCVTAFRAKRDIPSALALMASANVIFHLSEQAHLVPAGQSAPWWLTTFVVLIFVAVIWRVHSLMDHPGTDGHDGTGVQGAAPAHAGTDSGNGTAARTGTGGRTGHGHGSTPDRTGAAPGDLYGPHGGGLADGTGSGLNGTNPVRAASRAHRPGGQPEAMTRAYSDRTEVVHTTPGDASRTGAPAYGRTGSAHPAAQARTGAVSARAHSDESGVPGARTGTGQSSADATGTDGTGGTGGTGGTDRTGTPARTDAELLPRVQELPRTKDGFVTLYQVRDKLGVNQTRAVRLLKEAGLLRPEDADKHLV